MIDECIGINELSNESISLYPNPAKDKVTITFTLSNATAYEIVVFNQFGQQVYAAQANASGNTTGGTDPDLNALTSLSINDACVIEFDFLPVGDTIRFNYVFGSEEYHDYVGSSFNDVLGFFLSGEGIVGPYTNDAINIAKVPGTNLAVSISNVNCGPQGTYCAPPPGGNNCE